LTVALACVYLWAGFLGRGAGYDACDRPEPHLASNAAIFASLRSRRAMRMSNRDYRRSYDAGARMGLERQLLWWGAAFAVLVAASYALSSILTPFVAGTVLGYLLNPVADRLQAWGMSRLGATLILLAVFIFIMVSAALLVTPVLSRQLQGLVASLPGYVATLQGLLTEWSEKLTSHYNAFLQKYELSASAPTIDLQKYFSDLIGDGSALAADFARSLVSRSVALINVVSVIVVTPVVAFYMLLDWDETIAILDQMVPPRYREDARQLAGDIDKAMSGFLRGQSAVCLFLGSWYAVGLTLIGLNFGFLVGVIAGVLSLIPYVGSITAFVLSISMALVQDWPDWRLPVEAVGVVSIGLFLDGNVLSPRLVGASVGLHPVWLMFALFAFGALFGFVGMIVAVPVAAAAGVVLRFLAQRYRQSDFYLRPARGSVESR
jgi:predicted PurR-regulated permease PerM